MDIREMYRHIIEDTDPHDPVVAEEIKRAVRQSDGITDIQEHLPTLRGYAEGNVLEIGVHWGISTVALLLGVEEKGGHLWSVDVNDCRILEHPQWTFVHADSTRNIELIKRTVPKELRLLFIDGDHSYQSVLSDLVNYGQNAQFVMLHDADNHEVHNAIEACVPILQKNCAYFYRSHGLAILQ